MLLLKCKCGRLTTYGITCVACSPSVIPEDDYSLNEEVEEEETKNFFPTYDITDPEEDLELE